jgi:hypothetical protein
VPVVYVNDNFGRWRSDFRSILAHCLRDGVRGKPIAEVLKPDEDDDRRALEHMAKVTKADTRPSIEIDFAAFATRW